MHVFTILPDFYNCMYESHLRHRGSNGTVVVRISAIVWPVSASTHSAVVLVPLDGPSPSASVTRARRTTLLSGMHRITQRLVCVDKTCTFSVTMQHFHSRNHSLIVYQSLHSQHSANIVSILAAKAASQH